MDENKNNITLYNDLDEKDALNDENAGEQLDKENLKTYNYDNTVSCVNRSDEINTSIYGSTIHGENRECAEDQNIVAEGEDGLDAEAEHNVSNVVKSTLIADDSVNNYERDKCRVRNETEKGWSPEVNDINFLKTQTTPSQPLAAIVETHTITSNVKNVSQHLNQRHLVDFGEQILHGQQLNVHNLLDVAGSPCAGPIGALCDMTAFSKLDYSPFGDLKDHALNEQDFLAKKYYHPLYAHGICRWPGCELPLDDMASFVKHLKTEHCLDDRSTAQARVQMQVVSQLEMHLQKERDRLQAMMHHLYLTKHFVMPEESQDNIPHIRYKNPMRSVSTTPDLNKSNNNSNDDSDATNDLQSLLMNSGTINPTRKRICDKSPLALAGGLPYMLERAGLDVQQEIQRNREFYKNADVRPPFTYASLIRQTLTFPYESKFTTILPPETAIDTESPDKAIYTTAKCEFVKRRHLSRGRPRKYEPSSSPNSNSQQFGNATASTASHEAIEGSSAINDAIDTTNTDLSTAGSSSRQRSTSSSMFQRSGNKNNGSENNGGNDDYDICEVSQRSLAGCQTHTHSGKKQYCGSKQRPHLQGSAFKTNSNSLIDHNQMAGRTNIGGGVATTGNSPGVSGIGEIGSVGSLGVDTHSRLFNSANSVTETEDPTGFHFHAQSLSNDAILNSPPGSKSSIGRQSPNVQSIWSFGSSLSDDVSSAEFACINNDRYRSLVTGLHLQSLTQRHHFQQHKSASQRIHPKTQQQQNALRSSISNQQHDVRSLHAAHGYHIYPTNQDEHQHHQKILLDHQNQTLRQNIFGANIILSNTDKYLRQNIESRDEGEAFKQESVSSRQQHLNIRHHSQNSGSEFSTDEMTNHVYIHHQNGHEMDVKFTPIHKSLYNFESHSLNRSEISRSKRPADDIYVNKDAAEEDSGIVDCEQEEIQRKRRKNHMSLNYNDIEIKAEADSESELRNTDMPLRTKSY